MLRDLAKRLQRIDENARNLAEYQTDRMGIMGEVRLVGSALVLILIIVLVLNEVYDAIEFETDADGNYESPFASVVDDLESTGVAAISLLIVGLLIVAASAIMRFMGSGFGAR